MAFMGRPPKTPDERKVPIVTYIHPKILDELESVAEEEGRGRSELIRGIVTDSLARRIKEPSRWRRSIRENRGHSSVNRLSTSQPTRSEAA